MKNIVDKHKEVCDMLNKIYKAKNNDYGNSFSESYKEWGVIAAVVRMDDKMRRIKQLVKNDPQVESERLYDSVLDLANYSIMLIMEEMQEDDEGGVGKSVSYL